MKSLKEPLSPIKENMTGEMTNPKKVAVRSSQISEAFKCNYTLQKKPKFRENLEIVKYNTC